MSWSKSKKVNTSGEVEELEPDAELGAGAQRQFEAARDAAATLLDTLEGESFNVSLSGHCQADSPGSAKDAINISISAAYD